MERSLNNIPVPRLTLIRDMHYVFVHECSQDTDDLDRAFPTISDPFYDPPCEELVGAGYLFTNPLVYLIESQEEIPLINFKGYPCGSMDVSMRCWIDTIETDPEYLGLDREAHLRDFMGHQLILRVQIKQIRGIPEALHHDVFCCFKFFSHALPYQTPQFLDYLLYWVLMPFK